MKNLSTVIKGLSAIYGEEFAGQYIATIANRIINSPPLSPDGKRIFRADEYKVLGTDVILSILESFYVAGALEYTASLQTQSGYVHHLITITKINFDILKNIKTYLEI